MVTSLYAPNRWFDVCVASIYASHNLFQGVQRQEARNGDAVVVGTVVAGLESYTSTSEGACAISAWPDRDACELCKNECSEKTNETSELSPTE